MRRFVCGLPGLMLLFFAARSVAADPPPVAADRPSSMTLVRQALEADLAGRRDVRTGLLRQALDQSPLYAPARWHNGELLVGDRWLGVREAQQQIAGERALKEYRRLRNQSGDSAAAHAALAHWCRKQQWKDREDFHWRNVLRLQPKNREALAALQLQQYRGLWLTSEEILLYKDEMRRAEEALAHWQPILSEAEAAINAADSPERDRAMAKVRAIHDADAVPALASSLANCGEAYALVVIAALEGVEEQSATDLLTWQALASPYDAVRDAAIDELKARPLHSFVPLLMGSLTSPLELTYYINSFSPGDIKYGYEVLRDSPTSQTAVSLSVSSEVFRTSDSPVAADPRYPKFRAAQVRSAVKTRNVMTQQVNAANAVTDWRNQRIFAVLQHTTGQSRLDTPQAWWKWWQEHNELCLPERKPVKSRRAWRHFSICLRDNDRKLLSGALGTTSCFIPGTLVWTEAGVEPIEQIRPGDRVLSQDPETGELDLRFVLETTLRPASPTRRLRVNEETILCTLGHPFWVPNQGWLMAKELTPEDRLYTLDGSTKISELAEGPVWEAHNLVVEGFGTYFVGKSGLLVRDNNLGRAPLGPLPGYRLVQAVEK